MNGAQDLGGMMGFGPVVAEKDEPVFHGDWEKRVLAMTVAVGASGEWNIDASRFARESLAPARYLSSTYYQIWLAGLEKLLAERDLVGADEIEAGHSLRHGRPLKRVLKAEDVAATLKRGGPADRPPLAPAKFAVGDRITAKVMNPLGHTRLPRYVRGRPGVIERIHGCHVLPDSNSKFAGEAQTWLYSVAFKGTDVWGEDSDTELTLRVDLWESYLEAR